jgi:hypothetical protein
MNAFDSTITRTIHIVQMNRGNSHFSVRYNPFKIVDAIVHSSKWNLSSDWLMFLKFYRWLCAIVKRWWPILEQSFKFVGVLWLLEWSSCEKLCSSKWNLSSDWLMFLTTHPHSDNAWNICFKFFFQWELRLEVILYDYNIPKTKQKNMCVYGHMSKEHSC